MLARPHAGRRALHPLPRRAGACCARGAFGSTGDAPPRPVTADVARPTAPSRSGTARICAPRIAFASIGLDLPFDAERLELELRRDGPTGIARADLATLIVLNAKTLIERDADFSRFAGPHPAHLHLRGDARLGHRPRRRRRAAGGAPRAPCGRLLEHGGRDQARRPAPARLRPRPPRRRARPHRRPRIRLPRRPDALRPLPDRRQDRRARPRRIETPQFFWMRVAMGVCLGRAERTARRGSLDLYGALQEPPLLLLDARRCSTPAPCTRSSRRCYLYYVDDSLEVDHAARHRRERDVLEVGRRPRRLLDGGARHRRPHRAAPTARARASSRS